MNRDEMYAILVQGKEQLVKSLQSVDVEVARLNANRDRIITDIYRQEGGIAALMELQKSETPPDESDGDAENVNAPGY